MTTQKPGLRFKLVVEQGGKDVHSEDLHVFALRSFDIGWSNGHFSPELLDYFAQYPDVEVAIKAADSADINESTLENLAKSESQEIRRRLIDNDKFKDWASTELLLEYARADVEAASRIASRLEGYKSADKKVVADYFLSHANPYVRYCIVDDYRLPQKVLKSVHANDPDASVRAMAKRRLDDR